MEILGLRAKAEYQPPRWSKPCFPTALTTCMAFVSKSTAQKWRKTVIDVWTAAITRCTSSSYCCQYVSPPCVAGLTFGCSVTALAKTVMTAVTFGIRVPAGIFLPSIAIGSCLGRAVGIIVSRFQQAYPLFFLFSSCPADGPCVSPSIYAVIG